MVRVGGGFLALVTLALLACGGTALNSAVRFKNQAPVWRVNDRVDTPEKPSERRFYLALYTADALVFRRLDRRLSVRDRYRAKNTNSLGEVPDSTWFSNRIGVRDMTADEIRRGPSRDDGAEAHKPWTVIATKTAGVAVGFIIADARGTEYLLKFDPKGAPEMETGAGAVVQRLLWASGYNVPDDRVVYFRSDELVVADGGPLSIDRVRALLARTNVDADGRIRGLASKLIGGALLGGQSPEGRRGADPNDLFNIEDRREVRGQYALFAWVGHTDVKEANTLDAWIEDPRDPTRHYVAHYLIDFGKALGVLAWIDTNNTSGFAHVADPTYASLSFLALGLWKRPWDQISSPPIRGVGLFESESFDPGGFKTHQTYYPFVDKDRFDGFWGAKIIVRFTPEHIRAAVEAARYSDPRATTYLTRVLVERQRKTARYWFARVNPLDRFAVERGEDGAHRLCFDDLTLTYDLDDVASITRYRADAYDFDGRRLGWKAEARPGAGGRTCLSALRPAPDREGYTIVAITTLRGARALPRVLVHLAIDPRTGALRVIGSRRT